VENRILAAARPEKQGGGLGFQVTLRKALEAALPYVEQSFHDQPLIEARLRMTLGLSFSYLGDAKIAADQFQAARAIYAEQLGPHPRTIGAMLDLANSYEDLGRHAEALQLREETLALCKAELGVGDINTLRSMGSLANSYAFLGRRAEALKLREQHLALNKAKLGADHPDTLMGQTR
jgi:tetratricopeptide (TPR) repeat protein